MGVTVKEERHQTDVVVVGGGPAGLAAAIAARLQGLQVVVLEAAHPPIAAVRSRAHVGWPASTGTRWHSLGMPRAAWTPSAGQASVSHSSRPSHSERHWP